MPDSNPRLDSDVDLQRYARQVRFASLGRAGQLRLAQARCVIIGCGALGSVQANLLARAGVGHLRIVDRDLVETSNLQRQVLFDERDVADGLPKAIAAAEHLSRINSEIEIEPLVDDAYHANIRGLCADADVILDGTDNFETRFLINDFCVSQGTPWVYGGCIGAEGQAMTIVPGDTPCLRCLMPEGSPPPGTTATCDTAGILAPIINVIAAIQVTEAIKLMSGNRSAIQRKLIVVDVWTNTMRQLDLSTLADQGNCPCCGAREFEYLAGRHASRSVVLCGRNSVQISASPGVALSLDELERKLSEVGKVQRNEFLLRFVEDDVSITVFTDGRAIISGTADPGKAKSIYARYVGN
jgi:adenylyltransferase/sulfurtransferase